MFNRTHQYNTIKNELKAIEILEEWTLFECYSDSVATFGLFHDGFYHQFNIICDDGWFRRMRIIDLLNLERVTFFSHTLFSKRTNGEHEQLALVSWSMYENSGLN